MPLHRGKERKPIMGRRLQSRRIQRIDPKYVPMLAERRARRRVVRGSIGIVATLDA
jgi:hypothetical protein